MAKHYHPFKRRRYVTVNVLLFSVAIRLTNVSPDQTVLEGSNVTLLCEATGRPTPNITLTRVLQDGSNGEVLHRGQNWDFLNISRNASATYRCTVGNKFEKVGQEFQVNVRCKCSFNFVPKTLLMMYIFEVKMNIKNKLGLNYSLRASSRWSAGENWSTIERARHIREREIERRSRESRKWACSDLCKFFISTPKTAEKISRLILFSPEVWTLAAQISWENCKSYSKQQHAGAIYVADKEKPSKFMSSKDTHLIPSDLAFRSLVSDETRSCYFVARLQSQQGHVRL